MPKSSIIECWTTRRATIILLLLKRSQRTWLIPSNFFYSSFHSGAESLCKLWCRLLPSGRHNQESCRFFCHYKNFRDLWNEHPHEQKSRKSNQNERGIKLFCHNMPTALICRIYSLKSKSKYEYLPFSLQHWWQDSPSNENDTFLIKMSILVNSSCESIKVKLLSCKKLDLIEEALSKVLLRTSVDKHILY